MHADDVMNMLTSTPGLSDRQITDALFGPGRTQQTVNQVCRNLERRGLIVREKGANGVVGNFIADGGCPDSPVETKKGETIATSVIPPELLQKAQELGRLWAESSERPRLSSAMKKHWDALIEEWVTDSEMPLAVRKMGSGVRGGVVIHGGSGREVVLADNSPAQWAFSCALQDRQYSIGDLKNLIESDRIPFTFATKRAERSEVKYKATLSTCAVNLNSQGWKLCHIVPVGLKSRTLVQDLSVGQLENHLRLLLKPSNHFLVPKSWAGLGEIPEVIQEIRAFESNR
jgi:hypothetical protein